MATNWLLLTQLFFHPETLFPSWLLLCSRQREKKLKKGWSVIEEIRSFRLSDMLSSHRTLSALLKKK
jgi:hypothetical protein